LDTVNMTQDSGGPRGTLRAAFFIDMMKNDEK
jgi:hypothetical protein